MFDLVLRVFKENILHTTAVILGKCCTPNQLTVSCFLSGIICIYFILEGSYTIALLLWFLNRIIDGLDGTVARVTNSQSDFGGYFDILVDFIIYALIPIAIVYQHSIEICFGDNEFNEINNNGVEKIACDMCTLICDATTNNEQNIRVWSIIYREWIAVALLEGVYFVNTASLMMLSTILEKSSKGTCRTGEMTTISMPVGLIEGAETVIFYALFLFFHQQISWLYIVFASLVIVTIIQRFWWSWRNLTS